MEGLACWVSEGCGSPSPATGCAGTRNPWRAPRRHRAHGCEGWPGGASPGGGDNCIKVTLL